MIGFGIVRRMDVGNEYCRRWVYKLLGEDKGVGPILYGDGTEDIQSVYNVLLLDGLAT